MTTATDTDESIQVKPQQDSLLNLGMKGLTFRGEFEAVYDEDEEGYVLELDPQQVEFQGETLQPDQARKQARRQAQENQPETDTDPVFAIQDGYKWVGTDITRDNVITDSYRTLEELKEDHGVATSTRVGKDEEGNNIYQLIYSVDEEVA